MFRDCFAHLPNTTNGAPRRIRGAPSPTGSIGLTGIHSSVLTRRFTKRLGRGGPYEACWCVGSRFTCRGGSQPPITFFLRRSPGCEKEVGPTFHPGFPNRYAASRGSVGSVVPTGTGSHRFGKSRRTRAFRVRPGGTGSGRNTCPDALFGGPGDPLPSSTLPKGGPGPPPRAERAIHPRAPLARDVARGPFAEPAGWDVHSPPCAHPARRSSEPAPRPRSAPRRAVRPHGPAPDGLSTG